MMRISTIVLLFCALFLDGQKTVAKFSADLSGFLIAFGGISSGNHQTCLWQFPNRLYLASHIANAVFSLPYQANSVKINDSEKFVKIIKDQIIIKQL